MQSPGLMKSWLERWDKSAGLLPDTDTGAISSIARMQKDPAEMRHASSNALFRWYGQAVSPEVYDPKITKDDGADESSGPEQAQIETLEKFDVSRKKTHF